MKHFAKCFSMGHIYYIGGIPLFYSATNSTKEREKKFSHNHNQGWNQFTFASSLQMWAHT